MKKSSRRLTYGCEVRALFAFASNQKNAKGFKAQITENQKSKRKFLDKP
jgi:hypothetical protein